MSHLRKKNTDVLTPEQRSFCMSRIQGRNTAPEVKLRKALWAKGLRYSLKADLPGKPDIIFKTARIAIFVDGCFWHGCPLHSILPKKNKEFWVNKLDRNKLRDKEVNKQLQLKEWKVLRFWEHEIETDLEAVLKKICQHLNQKNIS